MRGERIRKYNSVFSPFLLVLTLSPQPFSLLPLTSYFSPLTFGGGGFHLAGSARFSVGSRRLCRPRTGIGYDLLCCRPRRITVCRSPRPPRPNRRNPRVRHRGAPGFVDWRLQ